MPSSGRRAYDLALAEIEKVKRIRASGLILPRLGLEEVPPEIGQLEWLDNIDLNDNQIEQLPREIGKLVKLDALYAYNNRLRSLPPEIGNLVNLRYLKLDNNQLTSLPAEIGNLRKLEYIYLSRNRLTTLPPEFANLPGNVSFLRGLSSNPLEEPLPTLLKQGTKALFSYLKSIQGEAGKAQYEAKVLLVGEGEVGKSSLVAALRGESFIEGRPTTHGIDIGRLNLDHPELPTDIILNTWDFGGQEVYRITHQFFFSRRCLYLVIWNPRQGQEANEVEGWIKRVLLRVGDEARVIVVATHGDIRNPELDFPYLKSRYGNILIDHCEMDSKSNNGIPKLKRQLALYASQLPQMGELINANWAAARDEILSIAAPQIEYNDFAKKCMAHGLSVYEAATLAGLLHDLGHIIHYSDDEGLKDIVVLQPEWLTKAIGYVLEDSETRNSGGILDHRRLGVIWQGRGQDYTAAYYPYFLRLMEKFDISYRLSDADSSLIGQLVPYRRPVIPWNLAITAEGEDLRRLRLVCQMAQEAPGLIAWLTVRNNRFATGMNWRRGVFLEHSRYASQALFELTDDTTLALEVRAPSPDYFFSILRDTVEDIIARRWPGLTYSLYVPCQVESCTGKFSYRTLQRFREKERESIDCPECLESFSVYELLTGFGPTQTPLNVVLEEIRESRHEVTSGLRRLEVYAAQTAGQVRVVLNAIAEEVTDCPRMFTLQPVRARQSRLKF